MEEKELFEQIKPLIEEYREYANQETPDLFNDFRANSLSEVQEKDYGTDREGEILKTLDEGKMYDKKRDNVITIPYQVRRELIEELIEIREAKKAEMRSTIFEKVGAFISDSREKVNQEIEEKRQELEEKKEEKRRNLEEKQQELEKKQQLRTDMNKRSKALTKHLRLIEQDLGKSDKIYRAVEEERLQVIREKKDLSRDINALEKECEVLKFEYEDFDIESDEKLQELVKNLSDFEQIYGKVNFESEELLDYIEVIIANYEEKETTRMSNGQVFVNDEPVEDMGTIIDMEENQILKEEFEQRVAEIEVGNEDLIEMLPPDYVLSKIELTEKQDIEDALKFLEGKKLLDILQEQAVQFEENSDERKKYESVIEKIIQREKQKEEKTVGQQTAEQEPVGQQPTGQQTVGQQPTGQQQVRQQTAGQQQVRQQTAGQQPTGQQQVIQQTAEEMTHEEILMQIEQEFIRLETGKEDLLLPIYDAYKQQYITDSKEDYEYANKILEYCKGTNLLGFYKDILNAIDKEKQLLEEDILQETEIKNIIKEIKSREKRMIRSTTIVIEPYKDLIVVNIKGREKRIALNGITKLISKGKELQECELISKIGINKCDPAIIEALTEIGKKYPGHKNLLDEYINSFNDGTDKIDDIIYYFNNEENNKPENYKEIVTACKRYAKDGKKYGMAKIEGTPKIGILDRIKGLGIFERFSNFINKQSQKRLESKEEKEYRTSTDEGLNKKRKNREVKENSVNRRNPNAFMEKMQEKAKRGKRGKDEEVDMSKAIERLRAVSLNVEKRPDSEQQQEEEEIL